MTVTRLAALISFSDLSLNFFDFDVSVKDVAVVNKNSR